MKKTSSVFSPNVGTIDRFIRIFIGATLLNAGFFWLTGAAQISSYIIGVAALLTGLIAYCGLYTFCKSTTCTIDSVKKPSRMMTTFLIIFFIGLLLIEAYASMFITRKKFLENFNAMNGYYKQTLFLTGQLKREEARVQYDLWAVAYEKFAAQYSTYRPYALRSDAQFSADLMKVQELLRASKDGVYSGDLAETHKKLESVRPIFQELFKRNGFSMEAMALVDFHDLMETLISASDANNAQGVLTAYTPASDALKRVEAEDSTEDIRAIRTALEVLKTHATEGTTDQLSNDAAMLKKAFIKVYLLKG